MDYTVQFIKRYIFNVILIFQSGHRVCAGETFARYTVFGTFAALMQNYNFIPVEGEPLGLEDKEYGFIITPKEAWIRLKTRQ